MKARIRRLRRLGAWAPLLVPGLAWPQAAPAEDATRRLPTITVSTPAGAAAPFDVPGAVDWVSGEELREQRPQAQFGEGLAGIPGLQIQNRNNLAQDLQLSIRGFGARSTFGVRGVRIYVDGIPATLPDGQGQTSNIDIASLDRIEVLRGPFSALYGNSSGGVLQAFTAPGEGRPRVEYSTAYGSHGTWRQGLQASGAEGRIDYRLGATRWHTDGWRDQSAATRDVGNGRLGVALSNGGRATIIFNRVRLDAQDPLGLTAAQFAADPRGAALAQQYDTRKTVSQSQLGLLLEHPIDARHRLRLMVYGGERATTQYQSIPPSAQASPLHAGGVIDLSRNYQGADLRWQGDLALAGRALVLTAGLSYDGLRESRRGYQNYGGTVAAPQLGVQGALRRDETNRVRSLDPYAQASWRVADAWTLEAGLRRSSLRFDSADHYVVGINGDDSGNARYASTLPVASLRWQPARDLALYASAGRGFETPTLNELSYRPDGSSGLNFGLRPAVNDNLELGAKARIAGGLLNAALFDTRTQDEIVTAASSGGRASFQNAGRTRRRGLELGWQHETLDHWRTQFAATWLDATYRDGFCSPQPCTAANQVPAGQRMPGIARQSLYAAAGWMPPQGWRAGVELRALSNITANDRGTAQAPGYAVAALHAGHVWQAAQWDVQAFARVDNLLDKRYAGSVIVNETNGRYFEPALGRNWTVGVTGAYRF